MDENKIDKLFGKMEEHPMVVFVSVIVFNLILLGISVGVIVGVLQLTGVL